MTPRQAISLVFFANGAFFAGIACRLPDIQRKLGVDEAQLGLGLLMISLGAVVGVASAGHICARWGSHRVAIAAGLVCCVAFFGIGVIESVLLLAPVLLCFGICTAVMDVAMNVNGVAVEKLHPKPIMSSLHGMFSLGALVWAGIGYLIVRSGASVPAHFLGEALVQIALLAYVSRFVLPAIPSPDQIAPAFVLPDRSVLMVGLIGFCAFLCEGAMGDWSAIYLRKSLQQTADFSTLGYFAFSLSMTATRFGGDAVMHRFGPAGTLRVSGLISAVGLGVALWFQLPWLTVIGFACVGLGMATAAPIAFSVGGRLGGDNPDHAIASIATLSYLAFLCGPSAIGFLAKATSLREALVLVVVLALAIVWLAKFADPVTTNTTKTV